MKKVLTLLLLVSVTVATAVGQCMPDPAFTSPGIYPDTIPAGQETVFYQEDYTIVVPMDTVLSGFTVPIDSINLENVIGLPAGLSYSCNPMSCSFPGGSAGCIRISGTPAMGTAGSYPIFVATRGYAVVFGSPVNLPDTSFIDTLHITGPPGTSSAGLVGGDACLGMANNFTNTSSGAISSYAWDFGDGNTSTMMTPTNTYASVGTYTVQLIITDMMSVMDTAYDTVEVFGLPTAFAGNDTTFCLSPGTTSATLNFNATGGGSYFWAASPSISLSSTTIANPVATITGTPPFGTGAAVIVTDANGCQDVDTIAAFITICAGINDWDIENTVAVYPNPTNENLTVRFVIENAVNIEVSLINSLGAKIENESLTAFEGAYSKTFDVSTLAKGVYMLELKSAEGIVTRKVIIE